MNNKNNIMDLHINNRWNENGKNILILSMSTLNGINENTYYWELDEGVEFKGISQLEPGSKYIIKKLASTNEKHLDSIIVIATPETKKSTINRRTNKSFPAGLGMYLHRISMYIKEEKNLEDLYNFKKDPYSYPAENDEFNEKNYEFGDCKVSIVDENDEDVLVMITNHILNEIKNEEKANLFIDVQGGRRTFFYTMFNTATLLRDNNVDIVESFAINFDPNKEKHPLIDCTKEYAMIDLVSGIRTFTEYGKSKELNQYIKSRDIKYNKDKVKSDEAKLIEVLRKIDQSISINDPNGIAKHISDLKKLSLISGEKTSDDAQFRLIIDDIKATYGSLLNYDEDISNIELIKWLVNKDFITQALTFVEDKIPRELICRDNQLTSDYLWSVKLRSNIEWENRTVNNLISKSVGRKGPDYYKPENNLFNTYFSNKRAAIFYDIIAGEMVSNIYERLGDTFKLKVGHLKHYAGMNKLNNDFYYQLYQQNEDYILGILTRKDIVGFKHSYTEDGKEWLIKNNLNAKIQSAGEQTKLKDVDNNYIEDIFRILQKSVGESKCKDVEKEFKIYISKKIINNRPDDKKMKIKKDNNTKNVLLNCWKTVFSNYFWEIENKKYKDHKEINFDQLYDFIIEISMILVNVSTNTRHYEKELLVNCFLQQLYSKNIDSIIEEKDGVFSGKYVEITDYRENGINSSNFSEFCEKASSIIDTRKSLEQEELIKFAYTFSEYKSAIEYSSKDDNWRRKQFGLNSEDVYVSIDRLRQVIGNKITCDDKHSLKTFAGLKKKDDIGTIVDEGRFIVRINNKIDDKDIEMLDAIITLYTSLKQERNTTNHASDEIHMEYDCIKSGILVLVEMIDRIKKKLRNED